MAGTKFKTRMNRLEKIATELEGGQLELEKSMALFEEGLALIDECEKSLDQFKERVMVLTADNEEVPFFEEME